MRHLITTAGALLAAFVLPLGSASASDTQSQAQPFLIADAGNAKTGARETARAAKTAAPRSSSTVAALSQHRDTRARQAAFGPKIGAQQRAEIRAELDVLDEIIADLESGRQVDMAQVNTLLDAYQMQTPEERLRDLRLQEDAVRASLHGGPKVGARDRERRRRQLDEIDAEIQRLERSSPGSV